MRRHLLRPDRLLLALLAAALPGSLGAQYRTAPPVPAYALSGVTVVSADGSRRPGVNVVIRDGLIEAMGENVEIPGDAELLEGDSLMVYPGLVDGHGSVEPAFPEVERDDPVLSWAPSRAMQGFRPHLRAADHVTATGEDLTDARRRGVVASGVHPDDGMAPGHSTVLVHRADADSPWDLVATEALGLAMRFRGASGVYPTTIFGVIALLRQHLLDAQRDAVIAARHAAGQAGMPAPRHDPDHAALQAALEGSARVFFAANSREDIRRALRLTDEFGLSLVLVGGEESGALAEELARRDVPVLFSVAFDRPSDWDPEADAELTPSAAREKERLERAYGGPAALAAAGVTVALTSGGSGSGLLEGARKAMEYGLPEYAALDALTTTPASLLGIPDVVRVAEGHVATFVVTDGELFGEDTEIAYTFVDGVLEVGGSAAGGEPPAAVLTGDWDLTIAAQGMEITMAMTLTQEGSDLSGSIESAEMGNASISGGTISGTSVTLIVSSPQMPEPMNFTGTITADGTRMSGSASSPFGELSFSARKRPGGDRGQKGGVR